MPQLNSEFFLSQLFWLFICFSFLFIFLWKISLPRISSVLKQRDKKINNDLEDARNLQTEAEETQKQIDQELKDTQNKVAELIKQSSIEFQNKTTDQLKKIDQELKIKIDESAKTIEKNKTNSLEEINEQIKEITKLTLSKISNIEIKEKEIEESLKNTKNRSIN